MMPSNESKCPKCGAKFLGTLSGPKRDHFDCGTLAYRNGHILEGLGCLRNQLATAKAENERLTTELATIKGGWAALREAYGWATSDHADEEQTEEGWVKFHRLLTSTPNALAVVSGYSCEARIEALKEQSNDCDDGLQVYTTPDAHTFPIAIDLVVLPRSGGK